MKKIITFTKTHYIVSSIIALCVVIGFFVFSKGESKETYTVTVGDVVQKVIVSGKTKPVDSVDLGFERNGKIASVYINVGSQVTPGTSLVSLDSSELYATLLKARANVATEEARLNELKAGTRPEELLIAEADVSAAEVALSDAQTNALSKMRDAYSKADDAISNYVDQMFSNARSNNPQINLNISDNQLRNDINSTRFAITGILNTWKNNMTAGSKEGITMTAQNLSDVKSFLDMLSLAVNNPSISASVSQTTLDTYRASLSTARANVSTAMSNTSTAEEKLNTALSNVSIAKKTLLLKKSGSTKEAIEAQEAKVLQNKAEVQNVEAQLGKMTLRSPISGVVTKRDAYVGEIVTPGKVVVSVISDKELEIESNVSEVSIGKVAVGNEVEMVFDAFPNEKFYGTVSYIEPAETLVDGVVNYKVTVVFKEKYAQIKSGLTAKMEINTAKKTGVVFIPQYAVTDRDGKSFVFVASGKKWVEREVTLGMVGQNGFVEVVSGLSAGEVIVGVPATK